MSHLLGYLDLGAGSMFLQMILAGALGLIFTVKTYWRRLTGFLFRKDAGEKPAAAEAPPSDHSR
jgi:hypothetical protein